MQGFVRNGKTLLSGIDPVRRAERAADAVSVTDRTLYFCPSPLYGYGLERFLERLESQAPGSVILCVEADPELYALSIENIPPTLLQNKKLHLTNECDKTRLAGIVHDLWGVRAFRRIETIRFTGGWQLFPELYTMLHDTLNREIATDWSNALTLAKLGRLYIRNFLRNLTLVTFYPSAAQLSYGDAPVLVLGAGPSLDETLDAISSFAGLEKRPFKIICVDTCVKVLKDRGIVPDLVVILESQHWNIRAFNGCRGWDVPVAVDLSALPQSARLFESESKDGQGYLFFTPWTRLRIFERLKNAGLLPAIVSPLGSVGLTAVELARRLTSGKIVCAGLDFSFTADKYHARGTPGHRALLNRQTRLRSVVNTAAFSDGSFTAVSKSGVSVYCNPIMKNYRDLFEQEFGGDSRLFDIEGTGLSLGVKTLSMEEVMMVLKGDLEEFSPRRQDRKERQEEENCISEKTYSNSSLRSSRPWRLGENSSSLISFLSSEKKLLEELRSILTGEAAMDQIRLKVLIDECDYLWAHFPDCAGGRCPDYADVSFLKRVRTEIDPMLRLIKNSPRIFAD